MSWLLPASLVRGTWRALRRPRPRASWTFRDHTVRETLRAALEVAGPQAPERTRALMAVPPLRPRDGVTAERTEVAGRAAIRFTPRGAADDALVLHFHGGGYVIGSIDDETMWCAPLARRVGAPVLTVDYRLAPEHPFPAALEDATAVVRALVDAGLDPAKLVLTGDSAGGGLALAALLSLRDSAGPTVAGAALGSPWIDLTPEGHEADDSPDFLPAFLLERWSTMYAGSTPKDHPQVSPGHADLAELPPLMFVLGDAEILAEQIRAGARRAEQAGVSVELYEGADAVHCWYRAEGLFPGPREGGTRIARFIRDRLGLASP